MVALGALVLRGIARESTTLIGLILSAVLLVGAHLPHLLLAFPIRLSRARSCKPAREGASNKRGIAESSYQEVYRNGARIHQG